MLAYRSAQTTCLFVLKIGLIIQMQLYRNSGFGRLSNTAPAWSFSAFVIELLFGGSPLGGILRVSSFDSGVYDVSLPAKYSLQMGYG